MAYRQYNQVSGGASRLLVFSETSPGVVDGKGTVLPIQSESLQSGRTKNERSIINGKRGGSKPFEGLASPSGSVIIPCSVPHVNLMLKHLCGAPSETKCEPVAINGAASRYEEFTALPAAGNYLAPGDTVSVMGTQNYDGTYILEKGTDGTRLVINALFADESISDAKAYYGRSVHLFGNVVDNSDGSVNLPVKNGAVPHVLRSGDMLVIEGSTNYDGEHKITAVTENSIRITAVYAEESLDLTAYALYYKKVYALPKKQPTMAVEKYFDFDEGAAENPYRLFKQGKINSFNFDLGGDGEQLLTLDILCGAEIALAKSRDESPLELPQIYVDKPYYNLYVNDERRGEISTASFSASFGIEAQNAIGDRFDYTRMPEGEPSVTLSMNAFLENDYLQKLSDSNATVSLLLHGSSTEGEVFAIEMPECVLETTGAAISGKNGLMQEVTAKAFVEKAESVLFFAIVSREKENA